MSKKIQYRNIYHNKIITEFEEDYSLRNLSQEEFENMFLKKLNSKIILKENVAGIFCYSVEIDDLKLNIYFQNLRNSGLPKDDKKRFQIGNKLPITDEDTNAWFIGSYNTGDKLLFVITEDIDFAKRVKNIKSSSSIWVDFNGLVEGYKHGKSIWDNNSGRRYFCFESNYFNDDLLKNQIKKILSITSKPTYIYNKSDIYKLFDESTHIQTIEESITLKRDSDLRKIAIRNADFKCEICKTEYTFLDKEGEMYFEGHHLIPYNYKSQQNFKFLLDTQSNITCLCPNCHKKIHHSKEDVQVEMLKILMLPREKFLKDFNINEPNDIINLYNYE